MTFFLGIIAGWMLTYIIARHLFKKQRKFIEQNKIQVHLADFNHTLKFVEDIVSQLENHKKLGCDSYIVDVPPEYALHPIFYLFIMEREYEVQATKHGYKFEIKL